MNKLLQRITALSIALSMLSMSGIGVALGTEATTADSEVPMDQGTYLGTPWVSGGVGISARDELLQQYDDYNLRLEFAVAEGNYLAGIEVSITTPDGQPVLRAFSPGPWLITKLPAGRYQVAASGFEETFVRDVTVPAQGMETVIFNEWTRAGVAEVTPGPGY